MNFLAMFELLGATRYRKIFRGMILLIPLPQAELGFFSGKSNLAVETSVNILSRRKHSECFNHSIIHRRPLNFW